MAKVRHDEIIPECNIDTNLVETLLKMINLERYNYDEYIVQHSHGIGEVTRTMQTARNLKDSFALGVVDDDPKVPNHGQGINPLDYGFPENTKDYRSTTKDESSRTNPHYKNLFKKLSVSGEICLMKNLLDKFVNERDGLSEDELKQVFKDIGY